MQFIMGKQHRQKNIYISRFYSYSEVQNADLSDLHRSLFRLLTPCWKVSGIYIHISHRYTYDITTVTVTVTINS